MSSADFRQQHLEATGPWAIAVIAARESVETLDTVVRAAVVACKGMPFRIDVLVNGNRVLAERTAERFRATPPGGEGKLCVWFLEVGDKAQTWNAYVHRIYQDAGLTYFLDGYAIPQSNAFRELALGTCECPGVFAATGVPSVGRSAAGQRKAMQRGGSLHGNLFALTRQAMNEIRDRRIRLPMGLYRTDSLINAAVCLAFDPARHSWDPARIHVRTAATWSFEPLKWWRWRDIRTHFKRRGRQMQGVLENLAVRNHLVVRRQALESLPATARDLVLDWWHGDSGPQWHQILSRPRWLLALRRLRAIRDWSRTGRSAELLFQSATDAEGGGTRPRPTS